jgi:aminoglycoside phosphotransferase (APT) family kinase protein
MARTPGDEAGAAVAAVGLPANATCEATTGSTGTLFRVAVGGATYALRLVPSASAVAGTLAAMTAARDAGLPVPELIRQADWANGHALLFEWMAGSTVPECVERDPSSAYEIGRQLGITQRILHATKAPAVLANVKDDPFGPPTYPLETSGLPDGDALLHLDWHPLNVLVANRRLSAVLDWDNARAGNPYADLARTHTLLHLDPALAQLSPVERTMVDELAAGWAAGYGPEASSIPSACLAWAGRAMLRDLAGRHTDAAFAPVRAWTASHEPA